MWRSVASFPSVEHSATRESTCQEGQSSQCSAPAVRLTHPQPARPCHKRHPAGSHMLSKPRFEQRPTASCVNIDMHAGNRRTRARVYAGPSNDICCSAAECSAKHCMRAIDWLVVRWCEVAMQGKPKCQSLLVRSRAPRKPISTRL